MNKPTGSRHENYEVLNLIGYGLAKFEEQLVAALGFKTKVAQIIFCKFVEHQTHNHQYRAGLLALSLDGLESASEHQDRKSVV